MTDHSDEWEDIDEKVVLVQILTELQQIRQALTDAERGDDAPPEYRCRRCGETVPESGRKQHAAGQHRAPPGSEGSLFERVG